MINEKSNKNFGAIVFDFEDKKREITQRFAFNLRYYKSSNIDKRRDGTYEFSADP